MTTKDKGNFGEEIACGILESFGFTINCRNYFTRQGEIDIVAKRNGIFHFIEVKTTYGEYNPADNFHQTKLKRLLKSVKVYCYKNKIPEDIIEIDLALVDMKNRRFQFIKNANIYFH